MNNYNEEVRVIRDLAKQVKELVHTDKNNKKRAMWANHNDLITCENTLLWVVPDDDGGWVELIDPSTLQCKDEELKSLEFALKKQLYAAEYFDDDFVYEDKIYFNYPGEYTGYLYGNCNQKKAWGVDLQKPHIGMGAYHLDNFLKTEEDFEKLLTHEVDFIPNNTEKNRLQNKFQQVLDGILEVEFHLPYSVLVQSHLIELVHLRGLEELMYDLYDEPERLQNVLSHMGESKAKLLKKLEKSKMLFENRTNIYTGSGGLGYTNEAKKLPEDVLLEDMWGFADAQEFSVVSPEMFNNFAVKNQKIGLNMFGKACYGCCEPMDGKYDEIFKNIPNLRRISVSPWANVEEAAEKIGKKAIYSWKPDPAKICMSFDENEVRKQLQHIAKTTRDCHTEVILKDIRSCNRSKENLVNFVKIFREVFSN